MSRSVVFSSVLFVLLSSAGHGLTIDQYNVKLGAQITAYHREAVLPSLDYQTNLSLYVQPEFLWRWNQGQTSLKFVPYSRIDQHTLGKSDTDIRELLWRQAYNDWQLSIGIGKVFWGVTEFNHLVDVINQTDLVEGIDGEEKLGQPMLNLSVIKDWGALDLFVLPGFRERPFTGAKGRRSTGVPVDTDRVVYESPDGDHHIDFALRWSDAFRYFDFGAYAFKGTNRDPMFNLHPQWVTNPDQQTTYIAVANYLQMTQLGIDFQGVAGNWVFKLEALWRKTSQNHFTAAQWGIEYTLLNALSSDSDVGLLVEYGWDERGKQSLSVFQNDLFFGARVSFNDLNSKQLLCGLAYDQDYYSHSASIEYSQRLFKSGKLSLAGRLFRSKSPQDVLNPTAADDYIELTYEYFF